MTNINSDPMTNDDPSEKNWEHLDSAMMEPPENFGHPLVDMTDREILKEIAYQLRTISAVIADFQKMGPGDMVKAFLMGGKR
jgi:hypothetical protein